MDWKDWGRAFLDLIYPGCCPICKSSAWQTDASYCCPACLDAIHWIRGSKCRSCGLGMDGASLGELLCANCREFVPSFESGRSMFHLDGVGRELIHEIKYEGVKEVLQDMPKFLERAEGFLEYVSGALLIPVPLHSRSLSRRGFNQSVWIAEALAKAAGNHTVTYDCLTRVRNTSSQTKLDRRQRRANVKNAFALKPGTCLDGFDRLILVDDVLTTGATLDACAKALIESGCREVGAATLGHG